MTKPSTTRKTHQRGYDIVFLLFGDGKDLGIVEERKEKKRKKTQTSITVGHIDAAVLVDFAEKAADDPLSGTDGGPVVVIDDAQQHQRVHNDFSGDDGHLLSLLQRQRHNTEAGRKKMSRNHQNAQNKNENENNKGFAVCAQFVCFILHIFSSLNVLCVCWLPFASGCCVLCALSSGLALVWV